MNDLVSEMQIRYAFPTAAESERLIAEAHRMRREAMRDAMIGFWRMLRRSITRRPALRSA